MSNPEIKVYDLRLDNSICDVIRFKSPEGIYQSDGVTPVTKEWLDKTFPFRYGVLYCHINPNDTTDRKAFVYVNVERDQDKYDQHERDITDFLVTPKKLFDLFQNHNYKRHIVVARLDNLEYVIPNIVKRNKIVNDGKTFCLLKDLQNSNMPENMKKELAEYDYVAKGGESFTPKAFTHNGDEVSSDEMGKITDIKWGQYFPIQVKFPNGYVGQFLLGDLIFAHEIAE